MSADDVIVPGWAAPKGYSNGRIGRGRVLHVAGQIGWDAEGKFPEDGVFSPNFIAQFALALDNVVAVVKAAGGVVEDLAEMTVFVRHMHQYRGARKEIGEIWRARLGKHYPAMALVAVTELFEPKALVEIQAVAYLGDLP